MPLIARQSIEEVRHRVNILDVVSPYTQLKRSGSRYSGLSPFTEEKTPSFFVDPDKSVYYCFSTSQGGDLFRFVMTMENLNFQEAIESLAAKYGIDLQYEEGEGQPGPSRSLKNEIIAIHEDAADYYASLFWSHDEQGAGIRDYWENQRKFELQVAREFRIGLAPPTDSKLLKMLQKKGYSAEAIRECGLFYVTSRDSGEDYSARPRFRGRLMIPINDVQGRVVAFTARQLDITPEDDPSGKAKYINSPETPVFRKGDLLFALDRARKSVDERGFFLMVEGQLDAIRCHASGLKTAVAPQGTAITEKQLDTLKRYASRLEVFLDGDPAGQKAAFRMIPLCIKTGMDCSFLPLRPDQDPDTLLLDSGAEALETLRKRAIPAMEFALRHLAGKPFKQLSTNEKTILLDDLYKIIASAQTYFLQEELLLQAARILDADIQALKRDFQRFNTRNSGYGKGFNNPDFSPPEDYTVTKSQKRKLTNVEKDLLWIISHFEQHGNKIAQVINPEWIDDTHPAGALLQKALAEFEHDAWQGPESLEDLIESDVEASIISEILIQSPDQKDFQPVPAINAALKSLFFRYLDQRNQEIKKQLLNMDSHSEKYLELSKERIHLRKMKHSVPTITD